MPDKRGRILRYIPELLGRLPAGEQGRIPAVPDQPVCVECKKKATGVFFWIKTVFRADDIRRRERGLPDIWYALPRLPRTSPDRKCQSDAAPRSKT